ncbi:MAG: insulinase family protein [Bacteroidota bacterium]
MNRKILVTLLVAIGVTSLFGQKTYKYETVPNDPLNTRIYTLENGLTVFISEYKEAPRVQTYVGVRAGSKNDPAETTGLAHYFEHMMFKGTTHFGTSNWEKEKPMIEGIEALFEIYRNEKDDAKRAVIYKQIDSLSYEASKLAIPNEYDKLMKAIGSQGTNAGTSNDYTMYIENIPSNQVRNWATIQADRFNENVLRLFHTELETVYEEKNMSLTNDGRKMNDAMFKLLYPNHPYGKQTTLGEAEHLKNPSMKNIRAFFAKYYVPNNMAVVIVGDVNSDETIKIIDETFGMLKSSPVTELTFPKEKPIEAPIEQDVIGLDAENMRIAYRFDGVNSSDAMMITLIDEILSNGKAGIIDININQKQKALDAGSSAYILSDYSSLILSAKPKGNQTLGDLKKLLLDEIAHLKNGDFPDWLVEAAINNLKLREIKQYETIQGRGTALINAYLNKTPWQKKVQYFDELKKITKKDIIEFANKNLNNNYVVINKRQGKPADIAKVSKPKITPIVINRNVESDFLKKIKSSKPAPISPVFIDYNKELTKLTSKSNVEVLYTKNTESNTFSLYYYFKIGTLHNKNLKLAASYLDFLGTSKMSAEDIQKEFYRLACNFSVSSSENETYISISGLSENLVKATVLVETLLADMQPNKEALTNLVDDMLKERKNAKLNQQQNFSKLVSYATYGANSPDKYILSETELKALTPEALIQTIKDLMTYQHKILYYGTEKPADLVSIINTNHKVMRTLKAPKTVTKFIPQNTDKNRVYFVNYDAKQSYLQQVIKSVVFNKEMTPIVSLFNSYFGGSMNAIVFQELREKRSLAYTARATFQTPNDPQEFYINNAFIATQNDKVIDAFDAYNELYNTVPQSDLSFGLSKEGIMNKIATERITKMNIIWTYLNGQKMGYVGDYRKDVFTKVPMLNMQDVVTFANKYMKDKPKTYIVLGNEKDVDLKALGKYGEVIKLTQEDIFGF